MEEKIIIPKKRGRPRKNQISTDSETDKIPKKPRRIIDPSLPEEVKQKIRKARIREQVRIYTNKRYALFKEQGIKRDRSKEKTYPEVNRQNMYRINALMAVKRLFGYTHLI